MVIFRVGAIKRVTGDAENIDLATLLEKCGIMVRSLWEKE